METRKLLKPLKTIRPRILRWVYGKPYWEYPGNFSGNPYLRASCIDLLRQVGETLDSCKVPFWLDWGTLLGCVREGDLIPHDSDIDLGIHAESWTPDICTDLVAKGLIVRPLDCPSEVANRFFERKRPLVPITVSVELGDPRYCQGWLDIVPYFEGAGIRFEGRSRYYFTAARAHGHDATGYLEFPATLMESLAEVQFLGKTYRVPADSCAYLENAYGNSWRIPKIIGHESPDQMCPSYITLNKR